MACTTTCPNGSPVIDACTNTSICAISWRTLSARLAAGAAAGGA